MKNSKRILTLLLALLLVVSVVGCGSKDAETPKDADAKYVLRIGYPNADNDYNQSTYFSRLLKTELEERSEGKIEVQLFPAQQLGSAQEMINGMIDGSVDACVLPHGYYSTVCDDVMCLDMAYVYGSGYERQDNCLKALNENDTIMEKALADRGIITAAWLRMPPECIISTKKIEKISDLENLVLWTSHTPMEVYKCEDLLGMTIASMTLGDVASGMQNGALDAVASDYSIMYMQSLYEYAPYILRAPLDKGMGVASISKIWLDKLPEDLRTMVLDTCQECAAETSKFIREEPNPYYEELLAEGGAEIYDPSDALKAEFEELLTDAQPQHLLEAFPEAADAFKELYKLIYGVDYAG